VVFQYTEKKGEFLGDAFTVLFVVDGADPQNSRARAIACAIEMQVAMEEVNARLSYDDNNVLTANTVLHDGRLAIGNIDGEHAFHFRFSGYDLTITQKMGLLGLAGKILISPPLLHQVDELIETEQQDIFMDDFEQPLCSVYAVRGKYAIAFDGLKKEN
jgi:adenylate cyclase